MNAFAVIEKTVGNVEAEMAVLGAMLCEPSVVDRIADTLKAEDFAEPFLGFVYGTIIREHSLGRALNPITLKPYLESEQGFHELGGMVWLAELGAARISALGAVDNAKQIVEFAQRRRLIDGLRDAISRAGDFDQPVEDCIQTADDALNAARDGGESRGEHSAADCLRAVIDGLDEPLTGAECGIIPSIDLLLGPLRPSQLIVGAGRPGMGKTATAVSYALGAAAKGHGVLFVSLEMAANELGERMAADLCYDRYKIPYERIRDRKLDANERTVLCRAHAHVEQMPLQIADRSSLSITQLGALVRRWKRRFEARGKKLEVLIVDYLQLMNTGNPKHSAYERVSEISRALKAIAKEHGLAVFALAQLSRAVESRGDKRPMLSDLRESGQIEQDADAVLFFLRDEYYLRQTEPTEGDPDRPKWEEALRKCAGRIEFICAKRRNGRTGSMTGDFFYVHQAVRG